MGLTFSQQEKKKRTKPTVSVSRTTVLFAAKEFRTRGNHSLYCVPIGGCAGLQCIARIRVIQRTLVKLSGSQCKTTGHESEKGSASNEGANRNGKEMMR